MVSFPNDMLKIFIVFLISSVFVLRFVAGEENNTEEIIMPRVAGGYRPKYEVLAKHIVSLRFRQETEARFGQMHFCAGSIIAADKILTAAHCLFSKGAEILPATLKVVAKTPKRLSKTLNSQEVDVKKVIIHSKYDGKLLFNDIALLILQENISLDGTFAAPIPLPKQNIRSGALCQVIGWGKLYMNGPLANKILLADLHLQSRRYCRKMLPNFSGKKICASNDDDKEMDACVGDSGGPLICAGAITGIVSYGYGCASGYAGIYTNVFRYLKWIDNGAQGLLKPSLYLTVVNLLLTAAYD